MLTKEECIAAINKWRETKSDYLKIKTLISPLSAFSFNREEMEWLINYNRYKNLHAYIGLHLDQLTLIIVPLNASGVEIKLAEYLNSILLPLTENTNLIETDTATTVATTVLSKDLRIISYTEQLTLSTKNKPVIGEKTAAQEIEAWSSYCLDWFYSECNESKGRSIFETFTIPFTDLGKPDDLINKVVCFFAFKQTPLYLREIPTLIFVAIDDKQQYAVLIQTTADDAYDWSQPCPPFCKNEPSFELLD